MRRRWSLVRVFSMIVLAAILVVPAAAFANTVGGQAWSVRRLSTAVRVTKSATSKITFTIRKSNGAKVTGYAISTTKYYERGPNDAGYHRVSQSEAYTVFKNWGGGGSCPAKLVYDTCRYKGKTRKVLSRVYFFMAGE